MRIFDEPKDYLLFETTLMEDTNHSPYNQTNTSYNSVNTWNATPYAQNLPNGRKTGNGLAYGADNTAPKNNRNFFPNGRLAYQTIILPMSI